MKKTLAVVSSLVFLSACSNGTSFGIPPREDNFGSTILYNNKIDIVWLVDDSSSMLQHQKKLSNEIADVVSQLNSLKLDYRMVVTTTSVGTGYSGGTYVGTPKILTASTPNLVAELKSRLLRGESGSNNEKGLLSLQNLVSDSYINADGIGFHREESLLLINVLSDEDDHSDGTSDSVVQSLASRLNQLKKPFRPNVGGWLVNFIGVKDTQCQDAFGFSPIGFRYLDLVGRSGGKSYSICTASLREAVADLQARVLEIITDYPLSDVPNVETIKVYMNGLLIPRSQTNGWDYLPDLKVIRFYGSAIPASDVSVRVEFTPASAS